MTAMPGQAGGVPKHARRIIAIWVVLSAAAVPLIVLVLGPHLPPGHMSSEAADQTNANTVMTAVIAPIVLLLLVFFAYSLVAFRARGPAIEDGAPIYGDSRAQTIWLVVTSVIVIALAAWGSYTLIVSAHGAGGGQGPNPIALPKNYKQALQVQVIGQQWNWTYRFPGFGGIETVHLDLPVDRDVELHVTSLDVTHSWWAYELGVKADAVPGAENIAFVHPRKLGTFSIRCAELCGLWHGHMFQTGNVVTRSQFDSWIAAQQKAGAANLKYLPPYSNVYYPEPLRRAG
jgi:cytochrome c oxidase subunit II